MTGMAVLLHPPHAPGIIASKKKFNVDDQQQILFVYKESLRFYGSAHSLVNGKQTVQTIG
ncbi:MAG: hypothetical protein DLM72_19065 [Candidatus Nitrosopolaris wilkensis]|nr:MAG: hypothetical protein DLM72_19065 [Candidatus Nitrosopolaris wilkensis]